MPMAFLVRPSKYRHVYGQPSRKENCYENLRLTRNAHDGTYCSVNPTYIAVVTESGGGGSFLVLPIEKTGRVDINAPKVCGHAGGVLDIKWSPFHDDIIASASEDTTVKVWQVPTGGLRTNLSDWQVDLHGHGRRVAYIDWHPTCDNIILSAGLDYKCIIWNVEQAEPVNVLSCHSDTIFSMSWNRDGSLFCTTSKDRKLRLIEPRSGNIVGEATEIYSGFKQCKGVFLGDTGKILTTGFSRHSDRKCNIWDIRNLKTSLHELKLDNSNGVILPYYDHDTKIVYLAGKGDGNIRYFEVTNEVPFIHYLNNFGSSSPQRGLGVMPKRGCDPEKCEIMRFYKLHAARDLVEPVSMIVPRKSHTFHEDIFPPTASAIASLTADEWVSGQNREPILISLKDGRVCNSPKITIAHPVQSQDGALNQAPTITTYKAVDKTSNQSTSGKGKDMAQAAMERDRRKPASLQNIKRLSTNEDYVSLQSSEKLFINDKIAAFEQRQTSVEDPVASPLRKQLDKRTTRTSSTNQEPPPDVVANGMKKTKENDKPSEVTNPCSYFDHKDVLIIDITKDKSIDTKENGFLSDEKSTKLLEKSKRSSLIIGDVGEDRKSESNAKVHVKKVWSPLQHIPPSQPWQNSMPQTDPELRKAYFRQVEEINSLKEQISLKDKRIHQLEDEMIGLRSGRKKEGESEC